MIFDLSKASDRYDDEPEEIEINSLEELIALARRYPNDELIIDFNLGRSSIKIYDTFIE